MCLAQGQNAVTWVRLEPTALLSQVKRSTTVLQIQVLWPQKAMATFVKSRI